MPFWKKFNMYNEHQFKVYLPPSDSGSTVLDPSSSLSWTSESKMEIDNEIIFSVYLCYWQVSKQTHKETFCHKNKSLLNWEIDWFKPGKLMTCVFFRIMHLHLLSHFLWFWRLKSKFKGQIASTFDLCLLNAYKVMYFH